jgi:hypothetical protein
MQRFYQYGVLIFAFSLPTLEALKHVGYFLMVLGFAAIFFSCKCKRLGKISSMERLILALLITSVVSTILNWPTPNGIKGLKHLFYYFSTFWMLYRTKYDNSFLIRVAIALVAGTLGGLLWEAYQLFSTHIALATLGGYTLEFNSINSVSRSGAFNATILFVCVGVLMDTAIRFKRNTIFFFTIAFIVIFACTLIMGGRGNVLAIFVAYPLLLTGLYKHKRYLRFIGIQMTVAVMAVSVLLWCGNAPPIGRFQHLFSTKITNNVNKMALQDQIRYDYWRIGIAQITQHPSLFGVGPHNFKSIEINRLNLSPPLSKETLEEIGKAPPQHSHNWVLTKWVEDGVAGIFLFFSLLCLIIHILWQQRPSLNGKDVHWTWIAALAAMIIAVISGMFNSAFTHENGWLTFFIIGLGAGYAAQNQRRAPQPC